MKKFKFIALALTISGLISCAEQASTEKNVKTKAPAASAVTEPSLANVDKARIVAADKEPGNWMSNGRDYGEQRFSPLNQINTENVADLGLAWSFDIDTARGLEATPLVIDGVMYTTGSWSIVYALDAKTGKLLWRYDPQVPREKGIHACCDVVNRGVAAWQGKIFVGTIDGRLIALDAKSGQEVWSERTFDIKTPRTITGAPRVVNGKVIIGHGGAEYGVRGYVSAYDTETGKMAWRFYTVPGNPADGFENDAMAKAAETWNGEWWTLGGGGTVWDSMAYDAELNLLYIGVGNGSPWNQNIRSPGGGDNLFLSSIVALNPDTGEYVWHYQTTPGETWDYTATQHIMLSEITLDGKKRKVVMQAPKNGFFYVLDRATGEFISAEKYVNATWATHVDQKTGRPVEAPGSRFYEREKQGLPPQLHFPSPVGGHNWHPMAYSPKTGLVYIPAQEIPFVYTTPTDYKVKPGLWNTGVNLNAGAAPKDPETLAAVKKMVKGHISAWDPVSQKEVFRIQHDQTWNGGMLATAGDLIFQGNAKAQFVAYRADNGEKLWSFHTQTGVVAPSITYSVDGEQYVAIMAGWGGSFGLNAQIYSPDESLPNVSRVLTFKLGGKKSLPKLNNTIRDIPKPPLELMKKEQIKEGAELYGDHCVVCHGDRTVSSGLVPDLRKTGVFPDEAWFPIVQDGILKSRGMVAFGQHLNREQIEKIRSYVLHESDYWYQEQEQEKKKAK